MIKEEFNFNDVKDYLFSEINLLITGEPRGEERCGFFYKEWLSLKKDILTINSIENTCQIKCSYFSEGKVFEIDQKDITICLPYVLSCLNIKDKNILVDITSLNHVILMYLTRLLIKQVQPRTFFAAYIRPLKYKGSKENFKFTLTTKISGVKSVPGFTKREKPHQTLCAFLGFEGVRLKSIIESVNDVGRTIPIVAFPSGNPHWFNITMWNSMDILSNNYMDYTIHKCLSESIFDAVILLRGILSKDEQIVLAPIGTRPHSIACAIYACQNNNVRIIYDYAVESEDRSEGISDIKIYHLTSFIET